MSSSSKAVFGRLRGSRFISCNFCMALGLDTRPVRRCPGMLAEAGADRSGGWKDAPRSAHANAGHPTAGIRPIHRAARGQASRSSRRHVVRWAGAELGLWLWNRRGGSRAQGNGYALQIWADSRFPGSRSWSGQGDLAPKCDGSEHRGDSWFKLFDQTSRAACSLFLSEGMIPPGCTKESPGVSPSLRTSSPSLSAAIVGVSKDPPKKHLALQQEI